jgi:O-antigen ligase
LVAFGIVQESWPLALALVFAVPAGILLNQYPLVALALWFLLMPFLPFQTVSSSVFWVVHRALIPGALGVAVLSRMFIAEKRKPVQLGWAELSMVVYLAVMAALILLTTGSPSQKLYELYDRMLVPFAAYWLIRISAPSEQDLKRWMPVVLFVCAAEIVIGFWAKYAPGTLPALWDIPRMGTRMSGTSDNPTPYAYLLAFCMALIFHYAMSCAHGLVRLLLLFMFGMGLVCIFLTFTRGCWAGALVVLLGLLFIYPKHALALSLIATPIIIILAATVFADEINDALVRLETQDTIDSRIVLAHAGEKMFFAKPITGWGFGNYDLYDWKFMERAGNAAPTFWDVTYGTSHNTYLTILAETGLVGFLLQFFPLGWWLVLSIKAWPLLPKAGFWSRRLLAILWLPILFYLIASQVMDMRFFWFHIGTWWLTLGLIGSIVQTNLKGQSGLSIRTRQDAAAR